jgi:hypothetical protein
MIALLVNEKYDEKAARIGLPQGCVNIFPRTVPFFHISKMVCVAKDLPYFLLAHMMLRSNFVNNLFKPYEAGNLQRPIPETEKASFLIIFIITWLFDLIKYEELRPIPTRPSGVRRR